MQPSLIKFQSHIDSRYPDLVIPAAALAAPLATFFAVPVLFAVVGFLVADLITGLFKARLAKKISSQNFGMLFERMTLYVVIFVTLHVLTVCTPAPFTTYTQLLESFVMAGLMLKEALSVLENIKAIGSLRGWDLPVLDVLIDKLGLDLEHIMKDVKAVPLPDPAAEAPAALPESPAATGCTPDDSARSLATARDDG